MVWTLQAEITSEETSLRSKFINVQFLSNRFRLHISFYQTLSNQQIFNTNVTDWNYIQVDFSLVAL